MIEQIKNNLIKSQHIRKINENASDIMAIAFIDIDDSSRKISFLINKLLNVNELIEDDVNNILFDIGDEFRHLLYHIKEMSFYEYLEDI